jgi:hypothetical protein
MPSTHYFRNGKRDMFFFGLDERTPSLLENEGFEDFEVILNRVLRWKLVRHMCQM